MRHRKSFNHLGRTASHRKAMLSNMASSLILHKRITTTIAKAKALRKYVEPLLTRAKDDTMHSRRVVFSYLQNKESVKELFNVVADKIASRPGGYTRIIRLGNRLGDNAEICMMELVDFNTTLVKEEEATKSKTRRGRRRRSKKKTTEEGTTATATPQETPQPEADTEEKAQASEPKSEADTTEAPADDADTKKEEKE